MTRHFVWLVPLLSLLLFLAFGVLAALATWRWPRRGGWLGVRLVLVAACLSILLLLGRGIHPAALSILAMGLAARLAPGLERASADWRRRLLPVAALLAGAVLIQWGSLVGGDVLKQWREEATPVPRPARRMS